MSTNRELPRRLVAEALGTAMLLGTVVGSGIMAEQLAAGNMAVALLGNTVATGAILVVLILMLGPVSGAHFNPAVTIGFRVRGDISTGDTVLYIVVQVAGAVAGAWVAHAMFELDLFQVSEKTRAGPAQWFSEAVATFALMAAILGTLRWRPEAVPYAVGLVITAGYWWTASTSFANPAVTIARSMTDTFSGIAPVDMPPFLVAQVVGALAATLLFGWLLAMEKD
jgi:glycerol uptake facilitator-like aquaporin